jgi:hypothetical protein
VNRQLYNEQVDYIRRELTRITLELVYLDGPQRQTLSARRVRLASELERLESQRISFPHHSSTSSTVPFDPAAGL